MTDKTQADQNDDKTVDGDFVPEGLDEYGLAVWTELTPPLVLAGRLKRTDVQAMKRYCDLAGSYWRMTEVIREQGEVLLVPTVAKVINEAGEEVAGTMPRCHPLLSQKKQIASELRLIEDSFGMSPLARYNLVSKQLGASGGQSEAGAPLTLENGAENDNANSPDNWRRGAS